ncbi:MAG: tetratricopeptide repeat protein, partial [Bryobacteraceae bacterium]
RIDRPAKAIAANAWNDLGTVYLDQGNLDEAERSLRNSIRLHEEVWGRKHAQLAAPIASLGAAMHLRHRFKDAERLYRRSLGILEKTDGRNHAALASVLNHLGSLRIEAGKYAEAEQLLFRGLRIAQENPQASWKERATMHCNLSAVYERLKQFGEAESHARAALDIWRPHTGEAHPVYALGLVQLAVCVAEQGRLEEAQALGGQAVSTAEGSFGPEHPAFKEILYAYSLVLKASGDKREAKAYRKRAEQLRDAAESDSRRHSVDVSEFAPSDRR